MKKIIALISFLNLVLFFSIQPMKEEQQFNFVFNNLFNAQFTRSEIERLPTLHDIIKDAQEESDINDSSHTYHVFAPKLTENNIQSLQKILKLSSRLTQLYLINLNKKELNSLSSAAHYLDFIELENACKVVKSCFKSKKDISGNDNLIVCTRLFDFKVYKRDVLALAYSYDGKFLVTGERDKTIKIWDLSTRSCKLSLTGNQGHIECVAFSPCGNYAVSGSLDGEIKVWDLLQQKCIATFSSKSKIHTVIFSSCSNYILSACGDDPFAKAKEVKKWNIKKSRVKKFKEPDDCIFSAASSSDDRYIALALWVTGIKIWDLKKEKFYYLKGHTGQVRSVSFSPDGKYLISGSNDTKIKIWNITDLKTAHCIKTLKEHNEFVNFVMYNREGSYFLSRSNDGIIKVWNSSYVCIKTFRTSDKSLSYALAISPLGKDIAISLSDSSVFTALK